MKNKETKEFNVLNKPLFNFLEEAEGKEEHKEAFSNVFKKMLENDKLKANGFSNESDKQYISGYADNIVDNNTVEYTTFRVSTHFPVAKSFMTKFQEGHPSKRDFAHMCILLFGNYEAHKLTGSEKGFYKPNAANMTIQITSTKYYNRIREFYRTGSTIPYYFYHYVPALLDNEDINTICDSCAEWFNGKGNSEFKWPNPKNKNAKPMTHPIKSEIRFVIKRELEEATKVVGNPIASIYLGDIIYTGKNSDKTSPAVQMYMDFKECDAYSVPFIKKVAEIFEKEYNDSIKDKKRY